MAKHKSKRTIIPFTDQSTELHSVDQVSIDSNTIIVDNLSSYEKNIESTQNQEASLLREENTRLKEENDRLTKEISSLESRIKDVELSKKTEIETLRKSVHENSSRPTGESLSSIYDKLRDANRQIAYLEEQNRSLEKTTDELYIKNSEQMFENTRLSVINDNLNSEIDKLSKQKSNHIDIQRRKVYTMNHQNTPVKKDTKYISTNGYSSWN